MATISAIATFPEPCSIHGPIIDPDLILKRGAQPNWILDAGNILPPQVAEIVQQEIAVDSIELAYPSTASEKN